MIFQLVFEHFEEILLVHCEFSLAHFISTMKP